MKSKLETIQYEKHQSSFHFFKRESTGYPSFWHFHPELELTYIEKGSGIRYIGDSITTFEAGDLVLIGGYLPHDYVSSNLDKEKHLSAYVFQFPDSIFQSIVECKALQNLFVEASRGIQFLNPSNRLLEKIKRAQDLTPLESLINLLKILHELLEHQNKAIISGITFTNPNKSKGHQDKISRVTKYIAEQFHQAISLQEIAQLANLTPQSFCRWFKQSTGTSFINYLNATRIEKACQLLLQTPDPIAQISFQTGFETVSHFNRTFKRIKKQTPKEYRKAIRRGGKA